ncbi:hypothetical protein ACN28S_03610 [Cystobacter fuscus]
MSSVLSRRLASLRSLSRTAAFAASRAELNNALSAQVSTRTMMSSTPFIQL